MKDKRKTQTSKKRTLDFNSVKICTFLFSSSVLSPWPVTSAAFLLSRLRVAGTAWLSGSLPKKCNILKETKQNELLSNYLIHVPFTNMPVFYCIYKNKSIDHPCTTNHTFFADDRRCTVCLIFCHQWMAAIFDHWRGQKQKVIQQNILHKSKCSSSGYRPLTSFLH